MRLRDCRPSIRWGALSLPMGALQQPPTSLKWCGDGIHPTPRGCYEMGQSVRLDLFK